MYMSQKSLSHSVLIDWLCDLHSQSMPKKYNLMTIYKTLFLWAGMMFWNYKLEGSLFPIAGGEKYTQVVGWCEMALSDS